MRIGPVLFVATFLCLTGCKARHVAHPGDAPVAKLYGGQLLAKHGRTAASLISQHGIPKEFALSIAEFDDKVVIDVYAPLDRRTQGNVPVAKLPLVVSARIQQNGEIIVTPWAAVDGATALPQTIAKGFLDYKFGLLRRAKSVESLIRFAAVETNWSAFVESIPLKPGAHSFVTINEKGEVVNVAPGE